MHYGTLRDFEFPGEVDDVRGSTVYDLEGEKIGKIDDVVLDHSTAQVKYAVVDSGGWLKSKKFLVPAEHIRPCGEDEDDFTVGVTKQQVESFPAYDEKRLESEDDWKQYEKEYDRAWHAGPVQHRHGSDRNITPSESEMAGSGAIPARGAAGGEVTNAANLFPERLAGKFPDPEPSGRKIRLEPTESARVENAAYGTAPLSGRWSRFEEGVRRNQKDILAQCPTCCGSTGRREVA